MNRLRAWWTPKEPVERAGLVAGLLVIFAIVAMALMPADLRSDLLQAINRATP